jgi:hypothetical protein
MNTNWPTRKKEPANSFLALPLMAKTQSDTFRAGIFCHSPEMRHTSQRAHNHNAPESWEKTEFFCAH